MAETRAIDESQAEQRRRAAIKAYGLTPQLRDAVLDDIAGLAAAVCGTSLAAINIIEAEHQWALASSGAAPALFEVARAGNFCTLAIEADGLFEVPDAAQDARVGADHPIRFYAGIPLLSPAGEKFGTLCVLDSVPRELSAAQRRMLNTLADVAMRVLESYQPGNRLGALIERSPFATFFFEPGQWRWLHVNDSGVASLGLGNSDVTSLDPAAFSTLYEPEQLDRLLAPLLSGKVDTVNAEALHRPSGGAPFPVEVAFSSARDGESTTVIAFARDLSERRDLERERHQRQQFFDLASEMFLIIHKDGRVLQANRRLADVLGFRPEEMSGHSAWHFVVESDRAQAMAMHQRCLAGEDVEVRLWFRSADGGQRLLRFDARTPGNGLVYAVGHDITESNAVQQRLRLLEKAFQSSANPLIVASIETSPSGIIEYVNPAFERVTGYAPHEAIGRNCSFLQGNDRAQPEIEQMRQALRARSVCQVTLRNYRKDGSLFHTSVLLSPVPDDHGTVTHYVGVQYDVSQIKQQQERIARLDRIRTLKTALADVVARSRAEPDLLQEVCDLTVSLGGLPLAWAGRVDPASDLLSPTAVCGARAEQIRSLVISRRADAFNGAGIGGRALRSREPTLCNDIVAADMLPQWRDLAIASGIGSVVYLPIVCEGEIIGLFAFYARTKLAFDDEEVRLLQSLVADVAFALVSIERARRIEFLASHDQLTGLPDALDSAWLALPSKRSVVVMLDVERLKMVNDAFGKLAGDQLLRDLAERMKTLEDGVEVSRLRSGPFVVASQGFDSFEAARAWVEQTVLRPLMQPFRVNGEAHYVSVRCGVAVAPEDGNDRATLVMRAESALLQAKRRGERIEFYSPEMNANTLQTLAIENELRRAIESGQFVLHYQPKLCLSSGRVRGFEALLRWQHPQRGLVAPGHFIGVLEDTGLIVELAPWLVSQAVTDAARLNHDRSRPLRVAVNVSQLQMRRPDFVASVASKLIGVEPADCVLDIEITESLLIDDAEAAIEKLHRLRELGVHIAIDDFGTGYSSLAYIARLPFDALKIDQSFVREMDRSAQSRAIVSSITSLAQSLGKTSIAEGVETAAQADQLRAFACDQVQGYLYGRPMPLDMALDWLAKQPAIS